jgi:hypothetical protein
MATWCRVTVVSDSGSVKFDKLCRVDNSTSALNKALRAEKKTKLLTALPNNIMNILRDENNYEKADRVLISGHLEIEEHPTHNKISIHNTAVWDDPTTLKLLAESAESPDDLTVVNISGSSSLIFKENLEEARKKAAIKFMPKWITVTHNGHRYRVKTSGMRPA